MDNLNTFKVFPLEKFDSVSIISEDINELNEMIISYLANPKHVVFNMDLTDEASEQYLDHLNFLSTMLKSNNYSMQIFSPAEALQSTLNSHRYRNLPQIQDLSAYVHGLDVIERELRTRSLLKSYVDETMKIAFARSKMVIRRGKLSIEDGGESFTCEVNYFQAFELKNGFFSFVIGAEEKFFMDFLKHLNEKELAPIFNEIINTIPSDLLDNVIVHDYLTHPYKEFPSEKIKVDGIDHPYFYNCVVMKVPLTCEIGTLNLEVWIPKKFSKHVYKFLNP
jgi:hypothetical protein